MTRLATATRFLTFAALAAALGLGGCGYTPEQRAASGGLIGAGTGAAIASAAGGNAGTVVASSLLGAGAGALIGANTRPAPPPPPVAYAAPPPPPRCVRPGYDAYGRPVCYAYYGY
jgi:hypothetical protein